jgi:ABC-2 type transport system ATP-binding protein
MLDVSELVKRYRGADRNAVDGISFSANPGEFFALLGPNGAGKTTTISILTTTLSPTSGTVSVGGFDVRRDPAAARALMGIIFQNPSLDMNLSGEENIRLHAILYGLYSYRPSYRLMPSEYRRRISEVAGVLSMESALFQPVRKLSGGMRRKLEIVRSLMHRPRILFLDEPTAGLDPASRSSLWGYLSDIRRGYDTTMILTTHYLEEAEDADRILILDRGRVAAKGSPGDIKAQLGGEMLEVDAADREALRRELLSRNLTFTENGHVLISLEDRSAYEIVRSLDTPLTMLRTRERSLEDVYLRIVGDE